MFMMKFNINKVLACYNERLSTSKEEEEEDFGEEEKLKPTKKVSFEFQDDVYPVAWFKVSFHEDVLVCPTYTRAEYDR